MLCWTQSGLKRLVNNFSEFLKSLDVVLVEEVVQQSSYFNKLVLREVVD